MKDGFIKSNLIYVSLVSMLILPSCDKNYEFAPGPMKAEQSQSLLPTPEPPLPKEPEDDSEITICNPFSSIQEGCIPGLSGRVVYLSEDMPAYQKVNDYLEYGIQVPTQVLMSELFVPTRSFSDGFRLSNGELLKNIKGESVFEFFALELDTFVALTDNQEPGRYQFAVLSDDGSIIEISHDGQNWTELINNDGYQATRMGCDLVGLELNHQQAVAMRVKWFQGPRDNLSLTLMWRKVDATEGPIEDELCGEMHLTGYYGPDFSNPDFENYWFGDLVHRGWKVIAPDNYILPLASPVYRR